MDVKLEGKPANSGPPKQRWKARNTETLLEENGPGWENHLGTPCKHFLSSKMEGGQVAHFTNQTNNNPEEA